MKKDFDGNAKRRGAVVGAPRTMVQRSAIMMSDKMMHQHDYAFRMVNSVPFVSCSARVWEAAQNLSSKLYKVDNLYSGF